MVILLKNLSCLMVNASLVTEMTLILVHFSVCNYIRILDPYNAYLQQFYKYGLRINKDHMYKTIDYLYHTF